MTVIRKTAMVTKKLLIRPPRPWVAPAACSHTLVDANRRSSHGAGNPFDGPFRRRPPAAASPLDAATASSRDYHTVGRKFGPGNCPCLWLPTVGRAAGRIVGRREVL